MTKDKASGNILSIQLLRGIAALMVVLSHSVANTQYLPEENIVRKLCAWGWSGVEIFFIISGFIIPYSMYKNKYKIAEFGSLMIRRIVRIEPPYIISIIIFLILNYFIFFTPLYKGVPPGTVIDWGNVLGHIGYINAFTGKKWLSPVYWTLAIEFEYYIFIGVLFPLIIHKHNIIRHLTNVALILLAAISMTIYAQPEQAPLFNGHLFTFLPYFLMGIALFMFRCNIIARTEFLILIAANLATCIIFDKVNGVMLAAISALSLIAIHYIKSVPKAFIFLGTISYSLYLTHSLVIHRIMVATGKIAGDGYVGIRLIICIVTCILVAWLYYLIAEKPFTELSKKIKYATRKNIQD